MASSLIHLSFGLARISLVELAMDFIPMAWSFMSNGESSIIRDEIVAGTYERLDLHVVPLAASHRNESIIS